MQGCWLPTPFVSFPFTSPPVRHRVPSGSERAIPTCHVCLSLILLYFVSTPVRPIVNRNTNPSAHKQAVLYVIRVPYNVASHLTILIPVGTAMIIAADVKYARVSTSIPTVNMWCVHTTNPNNPIAIMTKIIPKFPNASFFFLSWQMI